MWPCTARPHPRCSRPCSWTTWGSRFKPVVVDLKGEEGKGRGLPDLYVMESEDDLDLYIIQSRDDPDLFLIESGDNLDLHLTESEGDLDLFIAEN